MPKRINKISSYLMKPEQIAVFLSCTNNILPSERREYGVTNDDILKAGNILAEACLNRDEKSCALRLLATESWKETGDKCFVARRLIDFMKCEI